MDGASTVVITVLSILRYPCRVKVVAFTYLAARAFRYINETILMHYLANTSLPECADPGLSRDRLTLAVVNGGVESIASYCNMQVDRQ